MTTETKPVPRCEPVDEERFLFIHDCFNWDRVDGQMVKVPTPADPDYLPLQRENSSVGWNWVGEPGQTIMPSIHCYRCGTHGFWKDGSWVKAP